MLVHAMHTYGVTGVKCWGCHCGGFLGSFGLLAYLLMSYSVWQDATVVVDCSDIVFLHDHAVFGVESESPSVTCWMLTADLLALRTSLAGDRAC